MLSGCWIDKGNVFAVDNKALAYADKAVVATCDKIHQLTLNLPQLQSDDILRAVGQSDDRIIPVGSDKHHRLAWDSDKFARSAESQASVHHSHRLVAQS